MSKSGVVTREYHEMMIDRKSKEIARLRAELDECRRQLAISRDEAAMNLQDSGFLHAENEALREAGVLARDAMLYHFEIGGRNSADLGAAIRKLSALLARKGE